MKKLLSFGLLIVSTIFTIVFGQDILVYSQIPSEIEQTIEFQNRFEQLGINGSIIIYDLQGDRTYQHNPRRNKTPFLPGSTYKIPNSLIALETGVIEDDVDVLTWDGIERGFADRPLEVWNQDLNLRLAFEYSAVWFYQVLARRIGHRRMQEFVSKIEYGNRDIGNQEDIDRFWLTGALKISPQEQITFLRRLYQNDLPFEPRTINLVKDIAIAESTSDYILRGKTGLVTALPADIGWYVGYLEQNNNVYFFATNLDINADTNLAARLDITRLCLQDLGLL